MSVPDRLQTDSENSKKLSRRIFLGSMAAGTAGALSLPHVLTRLDREKIGAPDTRAADQGNHEPDAAKVARPGEIVLAGWFLHGGVLRAPSRIPKRQTRVV